MFRNWRVRLEVLTSIYKQSGRYEELGAGTRYQQLLEKIPNADPSKRQDMALMLAEILAGLEKYPEAIAHVDEALKIADGWRTTDPLWEPHAYALRAQIERAAGQIDAAEGRLARSGIAAAQPSSTRSTAPDRTRISKSPL